MIVQVASNLMEELKMNCHSGSKVIVSCYVNGVTPLEEDLNRLVTSMQSTGADIIKLVINATNITEISRIFHLLSHCQVSRDNSLSSFKFCLSDLPFKLKKSGTFHTKFKSKRNN